MRQDEVKGLELVNTLNAAAAAESECAKLKRMVEEERKLVQRLKLEKDDEAQMFKRKVEEIVQQFADARKDVEYATARADVAENEWIKAKRELQEERQLVQLLKPECEKARQSAMRHVEERELELANALNASAIAESECDKLKRMLEEERKLVQRLKLEKDDEAQRAKRKVEEIGQQLADARKDVEYATARADVAENEWMKTKRELHEQQELVQLLKPECEEARQSATRQVEEKELALANALNAAAIAESECTRLKRMLEQEQKLVQSLKLEKDDWGQMAMREVEEIGQQLADARKDVEYATTRADIAETEWSKAKKELQEVREFVRRLEQKCEETRQSAMRQVEEKKLELANALNACAIAEGECTKLKKMLEEERKLADAEAQMAKRKVEEIGQILAYAQKDVEYATTRADIAENEWSKTKRELQEKLELVQLLKLECRETRQSAMREVEDKELELANALNAAVAAAAESRSAAETCAICLTNEKDMAFGCGHMTCGDCGVMMTMCPICREQITSRLRLFPG